MTTDNFEYLVTGGSGFIGNELVRQVIKRHKRIAIVDNGTRTAPHIDDLKSVPQFDLDIVAAERLREVLLQVKPRVVFHLAAMHFIPECNSQPEQTIRVNVEGTLSLLRAARAARVEHVVFASSGAVYADSAYPLDESATVAPVDIYGWSKFHCEQLCRWFSQSEGLRITACRLFNNYGRRETNAHIIPEIVDQLKRGDALQLGNIEPIRDYIHTSDTARALLALAERPETTPFSIVNVATGQGASVRHIVELMSSLLGRHLIVTNDPSRFRKVDKQAQIADISLLRTITDWSPKVTLTDGMRDLLLFEGLMQGQLAL